MRELQEIGVTPKGYIIYRTPNIDIGGFDYISDSCGNGYVVVYALTSIEELEVIIADMKKLQEEETNEQNTTQMANSPRED